MSRKGYRYILIKCVTCDDSDSHVNTKEDFLLGLYIVSLFVRIILAC